MDSSRVINTYAADGTPAPRTAGAGLQPFKYNGNEWIRSGGLYAYDFNARLYHPVAAQFSSQDPLAENYYATSPYAFCGGNPIRYSDPTGMAGEETPHAALPEFVVTPDYDDLYPIRYFSSDLTAGGWNQYASQSLYEPFTGVRKRTTTPHPARITAPTPPTSPIATGTSASATDSATSPVGTLK